MNTTSKINIHWFRQDLRVLDNPSLEKASSTGKVLPLYIFDTVNSSDFKIGGASKVWLHHALSSLNLALQKKLCILSGDPCEIIPSLAKKIGACGVYWNRNYEPCSIERDKKIKINLQSLDIKVESFNGSLLWEPWNVLKDDGTPYRVFTPFYKRGCLSANKPRVPNLKPISLELYNQKSLSNTLESLSLFTNREWEKKIVSQRTISEKSAHKKLDDFISNGVEDYKNGRNFPFKKNTSKLSADLHWGTISPNTLWYASLNKRESIDDEKCISDIDCFLSELGWREFSYSLLYNFPKLPLVNLQKKFDKFPWKKNKGFLDRWKKGITGYPIVDAGMRELWKTGYMHNRLRMIVGSFLVKNLLIHWHEGEKWFWDCLIDADLANNSASWQWVAGSGADAAPYFRIFNPVTQGLRFDPEGKYTKKYVPELSLMPNKYLFNPWEAPQSILEESKVVLGKNYPQPIVNLKLSRSNALDAFSTIKTN